MQEPAAPLIGRSQAIRALQHEVDLAARSDARVLITGESGVGKEVVARLIHAGSPRRHKPLIILNCAGVPDTLLETELFGHLRGSFTGAMHDRSGLLAQADGGTVFFDEVGEMTMRMQAALLRFLETGELQRVGATRLPAHVDVRVISATNRDLSARIAAGEFRADLFYRLNVVHLCIAPLRERREDVPDLLDHFFAACAARHRVSRPEVAPAALSALHEYDWPGNVRELAHVVERLVLYAGGRTVRLEDLPVKLRRRLALAAAEARPALDTLTDAVAHQLLARMAGQGETFWTAVHDPFLARDLSRQVLRRVVELAFERAHGLLDEMSDLVNVPPGQRRRLLAFLRKHECLPPLASRPAPANGSGRTDRHSAKTASLV